MSEDARRIIPLSEPTLDGNASAYLQDCIDTNFVSSVGPYVDRFEREFAAAVGSRFAVACASGTAAIHVALRLLDLPRGAEVFIPTLTFIASANPALYEGLTPVLIDSEEETWNMDVALVEAELERRAARGERMPAVIEAVHILGHPAQTERLASLCEQHGIVLIEDAAEALGARFSAGRFSGRHVGTVGAIGCFSFNGNKIITSGGGGMLTTDNEKLARRAKHLTTQARLPGIEYAHDELGYNYRLTNLQAALGVAQLERLGAFLEKKREIADAYDGAFRSLPGITLPPRAGWAVSSHWLYTIMIDPQAFGMDRRRLHEELARDGIMTRPIWSPLHSMPLYRGARRLGGERAEKLFQRGLSLPCSTGLAERDQARVIEAVRRCAGRS
jgi:dTDP-4-amino-4,6-dideoxygalactose transaminase